MAKFPNRRHRPGASPQQRLLGKTRRRGSVRQGTTMFGVDQNECPAFLEKAPGYLVTQWTDYKNGSRKFSAALAVA